MDLISRYLLAASLMAAQTASTPPPSTIDEVLGTWAGEVEHDGLTAPMALQFERKGDEVRTMPSPSRRQWTR